MMKTFKLNESGDLEFDGQNSIRMVEGPDEKIQSVRLLISTNQGEWFLNTGHGLDYFVMLGQKWPANEEEIRAAFIEAFQQEPRVEEVLSLEFQYKRKERRLKVAFQLRMNGEEVEGEEEVSV